MITTFHPRHSIEERGPYPNDSDKDLCIICEKYISFQLTHFYCGACDMYFHKECPSVFMESYLTIDRPETHEHTLTSIRKKNSFKCDACGKVDFDKMNMYTCLPCNFFIHRKCIYLPKVIKLTRHSHRLFLTFQVLDCNTDCGLCNSELAYGYGGYICIDKTCDYKLHSDCATREDTWDGKDVEGEPEEDVTFSSLEEVDGKTIRHFSHHHDLMRLCVSDEEEDERVCEACILPIEFVVSFLACKECDFALHETCASLPRKLEHAFHRHSLTLQVMNIEEGFFTCSTCKQKSCGFMYRCCQEECEFKMDAKCASLADPLYIGADEHPLTLLGLGAGCFECIFYRGSKRLTLPVLVKCNYDTHPLTLCFKETMRRFPLSSYCEICERRIEHDYHDLYGCTECNTTVHVECAIGKYPYLKPGLTIKVNGFEIEIASNSRISRPKCHKCHRVCQDKLVFKNKRDSVLFCSIDCI